MSVKLIDTTANRLREAMNNKGLKQAELSRQAGIDKSSISLYLSGKYSPKGDKLYKLATVLNVSVAWLSGFDVPMRDVPVSVSLESANINNNIVASPLPGSLTNHETAVITAYRNKPELQPAVDKLLDVPAEKQELKLVGRDGKIRKGKEAEDYLREANEQAAKITDKPEDFGI